MADIHMFFRVNKALLCLKCSLFLLSFICFEQSSAQDVNYTLMHLNPLFINSANTGNFNGNWRAGVQYRNQPVATAEPFQTASASFDTKLSAFQKDLGVGLFVMNDASGIGGFTYNKVYASIAYRLEFNKNYFSIGLQPGYVTVSVNDWSNWDNTTGGFTAPSGETNFNESVGYADVNAGVLWSRSIGKIDAKAGFQLQHLNSPSMNFAEGDGTEDPFSLVQAAARINISDKLYVEPSFLLMSKSGASLTSLGTMAGYKLIGNSSPVKFIHAGVFVHNGILETLSNVSLVAGVTIKHIDLGISYDLNMGNYNAAVGSAGAFEVAIIYRQISTVLNSYSIPCERY